MEPTLAPVTPLGSRTPHAHPGLYAVIAALSLVIIAGAYWTITTYDVFPDITPAPSASPIAPETAVYRNEHYGLSVNLPKDWTGFTVTEEADVYAQPPGILLVFTHPKSTAQKPYERLPILIYPISEWPCISEPDGSCYRGAAPFPPGELTRNSSYVFALPPRYNYDFSEGFQALDDAIRAGAVTAFEPVP